jgi:hypothetical protein
MQVIGLSGQAQQAKLQGSAPYRMRHPPFTHLPPLVPCVPAHHLQQAHALCRSTLMPQSCRPVMCVESHGSVTRQPCGLIRLGWQRRQQYLTPLHSPIALSMSSVPLQQRTEGITGSMPNLYMSDGGGLWQTRGPAFTRQLAGTGRHLLLHGQRHRWRQHSLAHGLPLLPLPGLQASWAVHVGPLVAAAAWHDVECLEQACGPCA